ncbi:DUF134 domain-containing protein [Chloroflexota bacterium]
MGRPQRCRRVAAIPPVTYFKPAGIPLRFLEEVCLTVEEAEAIRLKDLEGLDQEQCAERMKVSRPTFQRILASSRRKMADALHNGKAIRIEGGNFELAMRRYRCSQGHEWDVPLESVLAGPPAPCPSCNTEDVLPLQPPVFGCDGGQRGRHRRGRRGW